MKKWKCCSRPMKNKLVYLTPAYEDMEEIVKSVNRQEEGGEGRADEFILKYAEVQHG